MFSRSKGQCSLELARLCWAGFNQEVSGEAAQSVGFSGEVDELHCAMLGSRSSDIPISLTLARGLNQFGTRYGWVVFCAVIHHTGQGPSQEHKTLPKADTPVLLLRPLGLSSPWALAAPALRCRGSSAWLCAPEPGSTMFLLCFVRRFSPQITGRAGCAHLSRLWFPFACCDPAGTMCAVCQVCHLGLTQTWGTSSK